MRNNVNFIILAIAIAIISIRIMLSSHCSLTMMVLALEGYAYGIINPLIYEKMSKRKRNRNGQNNNLHLLTLVMNFSFVVLVGVIHALVSAHTPFDIKITDIKFMSFILTLLSGMAIGMIYSRLTFLYKKW